MCVQSAAEVNSSKHDLILILDDQEPVINGFRQWLEDTAMNLELLVCKNYSEYESAVKDDSVRDRIKCMIIDLSNTKEEDTQSDYKSITYIKQAYKDNRIPLFIHSGYLHNFTDFEDKGTVFKIPKSSTSTKTIGDSIQLMSDSGFLNIFSVGGTLETKIMSAIHSAFTEQFKANEIEEIIKCISNANSKNIANRTQEVFERIALRTVYQNSIANKENEERIEVNSIEHYYRRTDKHPFWTGDIFQSRDKEEKELFFLATPRCNISNKNFELLLLYKISLIKEEDLKIFQSTKVDNSKTGETRGQKQVRRSITDDVTNSLIGERFRFLPTTPQFKGGFVDCMKCITLTAEQIQQDYEYIISLVDDLTNDVVRKAAAYLLRGGISDTAYTEAFYYMQEKSEA